MGGQPEPGPGPRRELRVQENKRRGFHVPSVQRIRPNHVGLCRPRRRSRDSGHYSVVPGKAVHYPHVEGRGVGVLRERDMRFAISQ